MNIPEDLQEFYEKYLDEASRDKEVVSVSPELLLSLIERIAQLETDSLNLESYIHKSCRENLRKLLLAGYRECE
jgi:hypothetical protein